MGSPPPGEGAAAATPAPSLNYVRLGLSETEMSQWRSYRDQWNPLFPKYTAKKESRTTVIKDKLRTVQKNFVAFSAKKLLRMAGAEFVNADDAAVLGFSLVRKEPVHPVAPIKDAPVFGMFALGGGEIEIKVRPFHDTKRASKMPGAEIEMRYQILLADEPTPKHIDDMTKTFLSSKADFVFHSGTQNTGYYLWVAMRWIVVNDPKRNGPWTKIQNIAIIL